VNTLVVIEVPPERGGPTPWGSTLSIGTVEPLILKLCEDAVIAEPVSLPAAIQPLAFPVNGHYERQLLRAIHAFVQRIDSKDCTCR
jgi:hypothetical protein